MTKQTKRKKRISISQIIIYIILSLWAITTIFPFVWVVNNSFKPSSEVVNSSFELPKEFTLDNYTNAFDRQNILVSYKNSLIISGSVTIAVMILATMMAFALTRYTFKGRGIVQSLIISSLMFPAFSTIIPVFKMMTGMELLNNPISVILPQIAGNLSFAAVIMMGFLRGLPLEMEEAAYMEGAKVGQVFTRIIIPLCRPSLATVAIFCFLWSYNDLFTQLIMIRRRTMYPISALLNEISSKYGTDYGLMASSVTLIVIPVLIVYIFLQKNIIKGLTAGAIKG
ncbi:raffinose/stachyose/melibiose transport system permease protein [Mobilisporobacter senegalensis]|uniref:Raffinose/stachyose/melibiose transport system permease protein n=1 Tax=Mobilisporobacter senegalensis TaxID=1329262 RepID=A0A3N1XLB4_9FIRM|nr:carbohydrate ABC transporter permease [Mobilisporobacter senegalensis]ROR27500.1 raffinose/stachyose/melibiose transport system permease protein [Mobilisporobacter senegalensis]